MDHYFPAPQAAFSVPGSLPDNITRYEGAYFPARSGYTTMEKVLRLFESITVEPVSLVYLTGLLTGICSD